MAGHVEQRGKNSFRLVYRYNGQKYQNTVVARNKTEASNILIDFVSAIRSGDYFQPNVTFEEFAEYWYKNFIENRIIVGVTEKNMLQPNSAEGYRSMLDTRILPYFKDKIMCDIHKDDIIKFFNILSKDLSNKTLKNYKSCLNMIFEKAVEFEVTKSNPLYKFSLPASQKEKELKIKQLEQKENLTKEDINNMLNENIKLDKNQIKIMMQSLKSENLIYQVAAYLAIGCGLRRGEIMGLKKELIMFENNSIAILKSQQKSKAYGTIIKPTKTKNSLRIIYAPPIVMDLLRKLFEKQEKNDYDSEFIFDFSINRIYKWFSHFLVKNSLPHISFHDLRHIHISLLNAEQVDLKSISEHAGHSNIATTSNIYTYTFKENNQEIANKIDNVLNNFNN